jgi:hypothetical protein
MGQRWNLLFSSPFWKLLSCVAAQTWADALLLVCSTQPTLQWPLPSSGFVLEQNSSPLSMTLVRGVFSVHTQHLPLLFSAFFHDFTIINNYLFGVRIFPLLCPSAPSFSLDYICQRSKMMSFLFKVEQQIPAQCLIFVSTQQYLLDELSASLWDSVNLDRYTSISIKVQSLPLHASQKMELW